MYTLCAHVTVKEFHPLVCLWLSAFQALPMPTILWKDGIYFSITELAQHFFWIKDEESSQSSSDGCGRGGCIDWKYETETRGLKQSCGFQRINKSSSSSSVSGIWCPTTTTPSSRRGGKMMVGGSNIGKALDGAAAREGAEDA